LDGAKVGGMIAEQHEDRSLLGVGINLLWAPPEGACLGVDRDLLLELLGEKITEWFERSDEEVLTAWRRCSATLGRRVRVDLPEERFEGRAWEIASDGALIVGRRRIVVGDVVHLRPAAEQDDFEWPTKRHSRVTTSTRKLVSI
ncbi:MAG: hypothetical protein ACREN8_13960, partial [Candidatus Dormibacteraceae bacterium]